MTILHIPLFAICEINRRILIYGQNMPPTLSKVPQGRYCPPLEEGWGGACVVLTGITLFDVVLHTKY